MSDNTDFITLEISDSSTIPKYKQIAQSIIDRIETGHIHYGQRLPSINQLSTYYLLSRDTVEKAYNELKDMNVITSAKGMGFYVTNSAPKTRIKVLILFNKLSAYKKEIYNAIAHGLQDKAHIDFFIYHCDYSLFKQIIKEHSVGYHYYVLMPHFTEYESSDLRELMKSIPKEKLILADFKNPDIPDYFGCVYQDFKEDLYQALTQLKSTLEKYEKLILVFPDSNTYPYPREIVLGFRKFCVTNQIKFEILNNIKKKYNLEKGSAFVLISETDLANLIQLSRNANYELGKDVGILSYNDTVLKEVLAQGITVVSTDFQNMGELVAKMILENKPIELKNNFDLIMRNSI